MRLADFILQHMEQILAEWEAFAATLLPAASGLTPRELRDHAREILEAIATDLTTSQTRAEQSEKSKGRAPQVPDAPETAAQTHAVLRARGGFDINQLVAEYRALRASVLRLWMDFAPLDKTGAEDMLRFNEAIDQAIAESIGHFHQSVERYRNLLLGMLGHDMRTPLSSIIMTARFLAHLNAGGDISEAAQILIRSGASMQRLLDDLTDFNRSNLGLGLTIEPAEIDLARVVNDEVHQLQTVYPGREIVVHVHGDTRGYWDASRVQQLVRNLVSNALKYGTPQTPVQVTIQGKQSHLQLDVSNGGHIEPSEIPQLFHPLRRGTTGVENSTNRDGLGLGLFIVREIAKAHGGNVEATCEDELITFSVYFPRNAEVT